MGTGKTTGLATAVPSEHSTTSPTACNATSLQPPTEEVVGSCDGMDVARQVKIELFHWNHLRIAAPSCPTYQGGVVREIRGSRTCRCSGVVVVQYIWPHPLATPTHHTHLPYLLTTPTCNTHVPCPPLIPKVGPCEGCLMHANTFFFRCAPSACDSPIRVVLLPSPVRVGGGEGVACG